MQRPLVLFFALLTLAGGCRKPLPSPDYAEASNRYSTLLAVHGDDAFARPEMDELVAQLGRVPEKSRDFAAAQELTAKIAAERVRVATANKVVPARPTAPVVFPAFNNPPPVEPQVNVAVAIDAGMNELFQGADFAALQVKFPGCMTSRGQVTMFAADGGTTETEGFELNDSISCKSRLPTFASSNVLLVASGKVLFQMPKAALNTITTLVDGGPVP